MARLDVIDGQAFSMRIAILDGEDSPREAEVRFPGLTMISDLEGQTVPVSMEEEDWVAQIHPGPTSVDSVSLSLMRMLGHPIESLYRFWMTTDTISPKQVFTCQDGSSIEFIGRRYHWIGVNKGISFETNLVRFESEVPQAKLIACRMKPLREVVDHPAIPRKAIATGGWTGDGSTTITYDVEDVEMSDVFGDLSRHAMMREGQRFEMGTENREDAR
jgi:hypothetical protein